MHARGTLGIGVPSTGSDWGKPVVADGEKARVRFAVGLFLQQEEVAQALKDLSSSGIPRDRINLVATECAYTQCLSEGCPEAEATRACDLARLILSKRGTGLSPWIFELLSVSVCGKLPLLQDEAVPPDFEHWALERQARKLWDHLSEGGRVLVIAVSDDSEQQRVCTALLHHASSGVQTHEIRRRT